MKCVNLACKNQSPNIKIDWQYYCQKFRITANYYLECIIELLIIFVSDYIKCLSFSGGRNMYASVPGTISCNKFSEIQRAYRPHLTQSDSGGQATTTKTYNLNTKY